LTCQPNAKIIYILYPIQNSSLWSFIPFYLPLKDLPLSKQIHYKEHDLKLTINPLSARPLLEKSVFRQG